MTKRLQIVTPVFNDWQSFLILLGDIDSAARDLDWQVSVLAIDDGSTEEQPEHTSKYHEHIHEVRIVRLATNVGHQRAIAIGLSIAVEEIGADAVLIMDSDGEDRPQDIPRLIEAAAGKSDFAVVARRAKRTNTAIFKLFYVLYKAGFAIMTGRDINFGNFSLLSRNYARRLIMQADLWNNLAGALLKSRAPITSLLTDRGHRYAGQSKMNFASLIVHGMSSLSVYSDVIFVRMLAATGVLFVFSMIAIAAVIFMRLATDMATPGWATTVIFGVMIILMQAIISTLMTMLLLLNNRAQKNVIPLRDYRDYVLTSIVLTAESSLSREVEPA
ncbi:glycosyltransferase [Bradyrhizobium symbiodeficiens]|uniref:Glycosyltransferase n=1 Tax=Bradyrhizobium symbiodeficiens TaxID=1404367 RepID=A0A6G9A9P6_9BRAD|nr:glycosyltransferase [Bradyrhizobium symbiodeficiens]QIP09039.1 glycosyltransferase [Bradyrhizobium symbiodeficiens]